jgi:hypothetical protein
MRKTLFVLATTAGLGLAFALPAAAADGDAVFTVAAGSIGISTPTQAALVDNGASGVGGTATGAMGTVTVIDNRGQVTPSWTATVTSSAYTNATVGGGTVPNTAASYAPGAVTGPVGTAAGAGTTMGTAQTAATLTSGAGNNTASWAPTISVAVPATSLAGTYTAAITHSVA